MSLFRKMFRRTEEYRNKQKLSNCFFLRHSKISSKISLLKHRRAWRRCAILKPNRKEAPSYISGSYTIEAAVILPFLAAAMVILLFFFQVMEVQWGVQRALEYTSRLFAVTACDKEHDTPHQAVAAYMIVQLTKEKVPLSIVQAGAAGMNYTFSSTDGNYVDLRTHYTVEVPLKLFGKMKWRVRQEAKNRRWVGYDPSERNGADTYVYITPYGSAYHISMQCPYLNPSIQSVLFQETEELRNADGSKYKACRECGQKENASSVVYVTIYGDAWHKALNCSGLKRTVYRVPVSSVEGMDSCSKCAG